MEFGDGVSATTAIAKCLVSGYGYINKRNFKGNTALDVVERLAPSLERVTIEKILRNAGASRGSLLCNYCTLAEFLISKISCLDLKGISLELRNIVLVVVVLIVTTTYQAALSPPGGVGGCGGGGSSLSSLLLANGTMSSTSLLPNSANITHVNVTILASTDKLLDRGLILIVSPLGFFYAVNTIAFIMSMGMVFFALSKILCVRCIALLFLSMDYLLTFANVVVPEYHFGTYWFVLWPCDNRIYQPNDEHSREPLQDATTFSEEWRS